MKKQKLFIMILFFILVTGCNKSINHKYSKSNYLLGTIVEITIYSNKTVKDPVFEKIFNRISELEQKLTINDQINSEVEKINQMAGKESVVVSDETFFMIKQGIEFTKLTKGKFDITIGALVKLWNIGFDIAKVPSKENIQSAIHLIEIQDITMNEGEKSVKLEREGMIIDLGGIAKGYIADEVGLLIGDMGYESALINLGGNILCYGTKQDGSNFKVAIRDPNKSKVEYLGIVEISSMSVVTSGIYERNFTEDGVLFHHILDKKTGYPVDNSLASVTILTKNSIDADALSTGVFVMGVKEGLQFIEDLDGVEAIFITKGKEIFISSGLKEQFIYTGNGYEIK